MGRLVVAQTSRPVHERVCYFMAYMNLEVVAAVLLVVALWRS